MKRAYRVLWQLIPETAVNCRVVQYKWTPASSLRFQVSQNHDRNATENPSQATLQLATSPDDHPRMTDQRKQHSLRRRTADRYASAGERSCDLDL